MHTTRSVKETRKDGARRTLHQTKVDRRTEHAWGRGGGGWAALNPCGVTSVCKRSIQRRRKEEEKQLLENGVASAVFSRAFNDRDKHSYIHGLCPDDWLNNTHSL
ncbi:hypothetical protein NQZ68_023015 [Dissostichus eleginoides]|nr:hypothetical protein NQZ68_023015 [Dissostichus eleginoides]